MKILGIETSCDDTACALMSSSGKKNGKIKILSNAAASQIGIHKKYGGVVPEVAARAHLKNIIPAINKVFKGRKKEIDAIAVASGPGLITSLQVGVETAKAIAFAWNTPLIEVNHIEAHLYAPIINKSYNSIKFPAVALVVSGGHTELILMRGFGKYSLIGRTRDDAAGEAFDKAAKMLGLGYPGGPEISSRAVKGDPSAYNIPKPMINEDNFEFSFSGMKNAIRLLIEDLRTPRHPNRAYSRAEGSPSKMQKRLPINDLCASIEQAIIDVLTHKSIKAVAQYKPKTFILVGGVSANKKLRHTLKRALPDKTQFLAPELKYCMDNAAMVGVAAYHHARDKKFIPYHKLTANANWELV